LLKDAGFDLVLIKPFPLKQLVEAVQHLCTGFVVSDVAPQRFKETSAITRAGV
jgi:hypothetical protein